MRIQVITIVALLFVACSNDNVWHNGGGTPDPVDDGGPGDGDIEDPVGDPHDSGPGDGDAWTPTDPPAEEVCNGYDDNLDGEVDEGCGCTPGHTQACFPGPEGGLAGVGICRMGVQTCHDGGEFAGWGPCAEAVGPEPEICEDGIDQDCDGEDEICPPPETRDQVDTFIYGEDVGGVRPVDIVWAVDQSGSMDDEIENVQRNINRFAEAIAATDIDYHVIMVAACSGDRDDHELRVPPPLGTGSCTGTDRFRQINQHVDSHDALDRIQEHIVEIEAFMRPGSLRSFVVVTDDEANMSAESFHGWLLGRGGYDDYIFHGMVGIDDDVCDDIADEGYDYVDLASWTGGIAEHICARDWGVAFDAMADRIVERDTVFPLSEAPVVSSIRVFYVFAPGDEAEQARGVAWEYNGDSNSITLFEGSIPPDGTAVQIRYLVEV